MHAGNISQGERIAEIKKELVVLYNQQTTFYAKGGPSKHTKSDIEEFEKQRERVRELFAELDQLQRRK